MMVSNGYSARRGPLRRPKVCKASPNPGRCHPPPPGPPWPGPCLNFRFRYHWEMMGESGDVDWTIELCNFIQPWWYRHLDVTPDNGTALLNLDHLSQTIHMWIDGTSPEPGPYEVDRYSFPAVWEIKTVYECDTWTNVSGNISLIKANFEV